MPAVERHHDASRVRETTLPGSYAKTLFLRGLFIDRSLLSSSSGRHVGSFALRRDAHCALHGVRVPLSCLTVGFFVRFQFEVEAVHGALVCHAVDSREFMRTLAQMPA
eukprot:6183887-Pleurochrysis_carterae.AAC.2